MKDIEISSKEKFGRMILQVCKDEDLNVVDAIVAFCEREEVNMEDVIPLLDNTMREEVRVQAIQHRFVRGQKKIKQLDV